MGSPSWQCFDETIYVSRHSRMLVQVLAGVLLAVLVVPLGAGWWRHTGSKSKVSVGRKLDDETYASITSLCAEGDALVEDGNYQTALKRYAEALELLPEPRTQWEAATWIFSAIGDAQFFEGDYARAQESFMGAVRCPDGLGNPFIHLRLGQCAFELGEMRRAEDELTRAYMGAGKEIFSKDDPKYFKHLQTVLSPPLGQSSL